MWQGGAQHGPASCPKPFRAHARRTAQQRPRKLTTTITIITTTAATRATPTTTTATRATPTTTTTATRLLQLLLVTPTITAGLGEDVWEDVGSVHEGPVKMGKTSFYLKKTRKDI